MTQTLSIGSKVTNDVDFTDAIGREFRAGTIFEVVLVGSVNARVKAPCGSLVWIELHAGSASFFTGRGW